MKNRLRLLVAVALLAIASACGRDAGDPVEARPSGRPSNAVTDTLPEAGTLDTDTTCRGGVLGSGGGKQGC
jgi:predicted small lipoprotein YifL